MTTAVSPSPGRTPTTITALFAAPVRAPSRLWLRGAFLLAGAAQVITVSALTSADPDPATWAMLLLATAPVLLVAAAAFTPAPVNAPSLVVAAAVLLVGLIGAAGYTGWFFAPALAALAAGGVKLWRERS
jgi:protein-S-isoprenylcysteine O-methyltransferase Ste14